MKVIDRKQLVREAYQYGRELTLKNPEYRVRAMAFLEGKLRRDTGSGDITTNLLIQPGQESEAVIIAKENGVIAGLEEVTAFYQSHGLRTRAHAGDGEMVKDGQTLLSLHGRVRDSLRVERSSLNFLEAMSGIATNTKKYVDAFQTYGIAIAATRKEVADEHLEKKAVYLGGGLTHRLGLDGFILAKDNHFKALRQAGEKDPVSAAIEKAYDSAYQGPVEVEADSREEALAAAEKFASYGGLHGRIIPIIMLDNMQLEMMKDVTTLIRNHALVEVSGNITLDNLKEYGAVGADVVSTSSLNRRSEPLDLSFTLA
ncbi:MAG: carboxylating nicotinate-nucleotide diphosphorylase [Alphaproteobacteria bacterium]